MAPPKEKRKKVSEDLRVRVSPRIRKMLEAIAAEEQRDLPSMINKIFEEYIEMKYHLIHLLDELKEKSKS